MVKVQSLFNEFWIPVVASTLFLLFQARGHIPEFGLTVFALGIAALLFYWHDRVGERWLFLYGVIIGTIIEVGFRFLGYQQVWEDASFFGIPFWLPVIWGVGFVLITRLGVYARDLRVRD